MSLICFHTYSLYRQGGEHKKISLNFIGNLLFCVSPPSRYEDEEEHNGYQANYGPQGGGCDHPGVGSCGPGKIRRTVQPGQRGSGAVGLRCAKQYVQVKTSRLMEQLSAPAVLLARHTYFPDMPFVRLLSLRVPCLSSGRKAPHSTLFRMMAC